MLAAIPIRRRRNSGSSAAYHMKSIAPDQPPPPPRPASTIAVPRLAGTVDARPDNFILLWSDSDSSSSLDADEQPDTPLEPELDERPPAKPLPSGNKARVARPEHYQQRQIVKAMAPVPSFALAYPTLLPPVLGQARAQARRLIVVLERACLEPYRVSPSGGRKGEHGNGKRGNHSGGDAKYTLLNCDEHQAILAKAGRDIGEARPDITHQASRI